METADVVIIGGGVLGGAVAFYLSKHAAGRVIVLERDSIANGSSSLAAGLLTRGRLKPHLIPMVLETYRAIEEMEARTGEGLGMRRTGCLYAAAASVHQRGVREIAMVSAQAGLRVEWLDGPQAAQMVPWLKLPRDMSVIFMPDDGYIDGYTLARGYLISARHAGVELREGTAVTSISTQGSRVTGVETTQGKIASALVIDAAGVWAGMLARRIGLRLPMAPVRSHYWITSRHRSFSPEQPFVLLPDARAYARPDGDCLLFGFREPQSVAVDPRELPESMAGYFFKQDPNGWESLLEGVPELAKFFPLVEELDMHTYIKGLSNYTPDGNLVLGPAPALDGFLAATGCAGAGIAMSGGIGRLVAELALDCPPFVDATPHRMDRFGEIDPLDPAFLQLCADARAGKITG